MRPFARLRGVKKVKRTPAESIANLLRGVEDAKQQRDFNFVNDLKMLRKRYTNTAKRDYLKLLDLLVEKYSTEETAVVHAALLKKCQAGDLDAIRLWNDMQKESGSGAAEVSIVDSI